MVDGNAASEGAPGETFDVVVKVNGDRLHALLTEAQWRVLHDLLKEATVAPALKPGDQMSDGSIYVGISPDTKMPMYTTPADAPLTMQWQAAMEYAGRLDVYGHNDWRVPTKAELNVLFNNPAAIGGFNETGSLAAGWYWSSTEDHTADEAWAQRFSDGDERWDGEILDSSLRLVR